MEIITATVLRSPAQMTATAMTKVSTVARLGSLAGPAPLPKKVITFMSRSCPMAWRIRGAPRKLPRAELSALKEQPGARRQPVAKRFTVRPTWRLVTLAEIFHAAIQRVAALKCLNDWL